MSAGLERAQLLIEQRRYDHAEKELRGYLAQDPESAVAHALLALCFLERAKPARALTDARTAVHLEPDHPFVHYVLALVHLRRHEAREATEAILESIRLDPTDAESFSVLAHAHLAQEDWSEALAAADEGLEFEPDHADCLNVRSIALHKMGRREGARRTLDESLANDPMNADTHAALGWQLLEEGDSKAAMASFREALRLNPEQEWAKHGVVEALKARNPVYRVLLAYLFWMGRLSSRARWGVILGAYFGHKVVRAIARTHPGLSPWLMPIVWLYIAFVALTWIGQPVFNLMLRLHPDGRYALSKEQVREANVIGLMLAAAIGGGVVYAVGSGEVAGNGLLIAILCLFLTIPISGYFSAGPRGRRMIAIAIAANVALALAILLMDKPGDVFLLFFAVAFATPWYVNYHIMSGR